MSIKLEPHNQESYERANELLETRKRAAILDASGLGKTYRSMKLIEDNPDSKFLYVNIYKVMLHKFKRDLIDNEVPYSKEKLERKTYRGLISLMKQGKLEELTGFDYIILDEFQICGAPETQKAIEMLLSHNPDAKVLGLSATPIRFFDDDDARDMAEELFGDAIASEITEEEAQERGLKKRPIYTVGLYEYEKIVDELESQIKDCSDEEKRKMAESELKTLREYLNSEVKGLPELLETAMTNKSGKYIVYCKNIEDMEEKMQEAEKMFEKVNSNITVRCVASNRDDLSNERAIRDFDRDNDDETLKLLFSVDMINLAYHPNEIDGVVMMRPTHSPNLYYCQYGRATSVNSEKQPVIVDLADNIDTIEIIEGYFGDQLRSEKNDDIDKKDAIDSRKINISGKILEIQKIIRKINELLKRRNKLTDKEKYEIMMEFMKQAEETGESLKEDTVYNGYNIGVWRTNLRTRYWKNGLLDMDPELLQAFKDTGIIIEKKKRTIMTEDEKIEFFMSLLEKNERERYRAILNLPNGATTYENMVRWLQKKYNEEEIEIPDEKIIALKEKLILKLSPKEKDELVEKYKIPLKDINYITGRLGTFEKFLSEYKKGEYNYAFKRDVFAGPRAVAISSKEITELQKLGYYNLLNNIEPIDKRDLCRIDIDEIEYMLSNANIEERNMEWLRLYYGIDGEKSSFEEIGEKYEVDAATVHRNIVQVLMKLQEPSIFRQSCIVDISEGYIKRLKEELQHTIRTSQKKKIIASLEECFLYPEQLEYYLNEENIFDPNTIIPSVERKLTFEDNSEEIAVNEQEEYNDINGDLEIEYLEFSTRLYKCLRRAKISTLKDLYDYIEKDGKADFEDLKEIKNFGKKTLDEMIDKLVTIGLLKKNEEGEFELQPDRLYPEKHGVSEVGDAVSDLIESQIYGTLKEISEKAQKENLEQQNDKSINEEN